ncbi:alpha/beta hydrolase fold [Rhizorhabdus wittichii RW1]|uniref:Alpha/beta hydrolase fold n=1 Tax=Rhizorhabdus wittichii (strain DSM 6014 / CCUG 31198 / JCM 15750 / NBRC 105917 / EY 4224 / RW1) TaxID=392499 RepID=A0A9J9HAA6_RHIWR|nr:alpha/beta hydrolase [Rhizorhabdus wittichii]ABQ67935.1 alpha/beta hydrolase fold [Rhizorhabdus wittichii RW1]
MASSPTRYEPFGAKAADGVSLTGYVAGAPDGPAIVLLHPIGFDGRFWRAVVDRLQDRFRLIVPDARGHGGSGRGGETSIEQLAGDVEAILDHLGVDRAAVAGCSMGSATSMHLGAAVPDRWTWLALANAPAKIPLPRERFEEVIAAARAGRFAEIARDMLGRWVAPETRRLRPEWFTERLSDMLDTDAEGFADAFAALRDSDRRDDLGRIRAATLVITGDQDGGFSAADAESMALAVPHGRSCTVSSAAHLVPLEQPEAFASRLRDFDERVSELPIEKRPV